jgi:hypothetical protein
MKLQVLNPVAAKTDKKRTAQSARLPNLEGKVIGLYWNYKPGGDAALKRVAERLKARYAGIETRTYEGSMGSDTRRLTTEGLNRMAAECAAVIGSTAD